MLGLSVGPGLDGLREFTVLVDGGLADGALLRSDAFLADSVSGANAQAEQVVAVASGLLPFNLSVTGTPNPVQEDYEVGFTVTVSNPICSMAPCQ